MLFSITSRVLNRVTLNRTTMAVDKVTRDEQGGFRKDISCFFSIDVQDGPPVPTEGARRVAKLASMRFLRERIRLT